VLKKQNVFTALSAVAVLTALAGCSSSSEPLEVEDAWAKAADSGMTAVFAEITNPSSADVTMVGGGTDVAAMVELHEVANGVMREKSGGHLIPAGETLSLMPGGDHIMLMGLTEPLLAGDTLSVTIELDNGETLVIDAQVRDYQGANEEYHGDGMDMDGGDMGHGDMDMEQDGSGEGEMNQNGMK
jgi:copper(I)-binding protein